MKVYLLIDIDCGTSWEDGREVRGVFASREAAEAAVPERIKYREWQVDEFEVE